MLQDHIEKSMKKIENSASKTKDEIRKYKNWCQKAKTELDRMIEGDFTEELRRLGELFRNANQKATESVELLNSTLRSMREMSNAIIHTME